jgi:hypothetical protein
VLVAAPVEQPQIARRPHEEAKPLKPEIAVRQHGVASAGVGRADQRIQHIQSGDLDAVAEDELLRARELVDGGDQSEQELVHRFQRGSGAASVVGRFVHGVSRASGGRVAKMSWPWGEGRNAPDGSVPQESEVCGHGTSSPGPL